MLTAEFSETKKAWIDLRQQAHYWKTQHAKAIEREAVWKIKVQELEAIRKQDAQTKELLLNNQRLEVLSDMDKFQAANQLLYSGQCHIIQVRTLYHPLTFSIV